MLSAAAVATLPDGEGVATVRRGRVQVGDRVSVGVLDHQRSVSLTIA
jgi:hypothetical protein